jgi:hypothetical protein
MDPDTQERRPVEGFDHAEGGSGAAATVGPHCHPLPIDGMAPDRHVDDAFTPGRDAQHEGQVFLLHGPGRELAGQGAMGFIVLGHHEEARRAAIETVDDPGPEDAADARQVAQAVEQRVDQRSGRRPGPGVHDEAGRLVDDHEVLVLVHDPQRDVLGLWEGRHWLRPIQVDLLARLQAHRRSYGLPFEADIPRSDHGLQARACFVRETRSEPAIEALPSPVLFDRQAVAAARLFAR